MTSKKRHIYVFADWDFLDDELLMGTLNSEQLRGKEVFSFEYNQKWLESGYAQLLDPDLQFFTGPQFLPENKINFGLFTDSSPDRWGRVLMRRREALRARIAKEKPNKLFETDYLLGVFDGHRMGGLRFKTTFNGPYLSDEKELATPPWTSIRELEQISLKLEDDDSINNPNYGKWLAILMAPGSSLGGARPKASIVDESNQLWIAKFPSKNDDINIGGWEYLTYILAIKAGIQMAKSMHKKYSNHHTFLSRRFDRTTEGKRIHFASAMTLLGYTDGASSEIGASYLELAEFIIKYCIHPNKDLKELWRRIVFSICVSNTDDHLRNHGFLLDRNGWSLSPAYDINPNEFSDGLKLNISEDDNSLSLDLALEVSQYFNLSLKESKQIIGEVSDTVSDWHKEAKNIGLGNLEIERMASAFTF